MEKRIWNWRQSLAVLDLLQKQIEDSAWSNKAVKFTPDDFYGIKDAFNMFRDAYHEREANTVEYGDFYPELDNDF